MTEDAIKKQPYSLAARESAKNENNELEEKQVYRKSLNDNNLLFTVYPENNPVVASGPHLTDLEKDRQLFHCNRHSIFKGVSKMMVHCGAINWRKI